MFGGGARIPRLLFFAQNRRPCRYNRLSVNDRAFSAVSEARLTLFQARDRALFQARGWRCFQTHGNRKRGHCFQTHGNRKRGRCFKRAAIEIAGVVSSARRSKARALLSSARQPEARALLSNARQRAQKKSPACAGDLSFACENYFLRFSSKAFSMSASSLGSVPSLSNLE